MILPIRTRALALLLPLAAACVADGTITGTGDDEEADAYAGYDGDGEDETPAAPEEEPLTRACASLLTSADEVPDVEPVALQSVGSVRIRVWFHVLKSGRRADEGNVAPGRIEAQLAVLNAAYAETPFRFVLAGVTRTTDRRWYRMSLEAERDAKQALHRGDRGVLNLYTARPSDHSLGWATFPWSKQDLWRDGVVIDHRSMPGGAFGRFSLGNTAVHEVGHWLGLFHTFQGGCGENGDRVSDTPAEAAPAYGCPVGRDSCPDLPGTDPVHNLMNYGDDACIFEFTPEQRLRMDAYHAAFR